MKNTKPCLVCGGPALVRQNRWKRTKYCSRRCHAKANGVLTGKQSRDLASARRSNIEQPTGYRLVALTRGAVAKLDVEDYEFASSSNWAYTDTGYARRTEGYENKRNVRLHRLIMERKIGRALMASEQVDHINGDRLDNRRHNLRLATVRENSTNARRKNICSGYRGVSPNHKRWNTKIQVDRHPVYIGTFDTAEEAAWMYDQYAVQLHGDFAVLNFGYI